MNRYIWFIDSALTIKIQVEDCASVPEEYAPQCQSFFVEYYLDLFKDYPKEFNLRSYKDKYPGKSDRDYMRMHLADRFEERYWLLIIRLDQVIKGMRCIHMMVYILIYSSVGLLRIFEIHNRYLMRQILNLKRLFLWVRR